MIYLFSDKTGYEGVIHMPLIEIVFYNKEVNLQGFDAIVFTSKSSVEALDKLTQKWRNLDAYAIGEATASYITQKGGKVVYVSPVAYGDAFAQHLIPLLHQRKVFFPRAKEIVSTLATQMQEQGIELVEEVLYETQCVHYAALCAPEPYAKLIFTSPSTVACFFKNFVWHESYQAIAIGTKTASALPLHVKCHIPSKQTIEACITLAKGI